MSKLSETSETSELPIKKSNENLSDIESTIRPGDLLSEDSEKHEIQKGGNKNIFRSSKYSETSSQKYSNLSNISKTSSLNFNGRSDRYSETSELQQIGAGNSIDSIDTLRSLSELNGRKNKSSNYQLKLDIFKKAQKGGEKLEQDINKKIMELGIHSSSTSSICE